MGDTVRIVKILGTNSSRYDKYLGKTTTITNIDGEDAEYPYRVDCDGGEGRWKHDEFVKACKEGPTLYVVTYDIEDHDPVEKFSSKKELDTWLKLAKTNNEIVFESIKVYEVKREYEVKMSFSLKKK